VRGDQTRRLFSLSTNGRLTLWSSALDDADASLVRGSGAGSFEEWWARHRPLPSKARDAHSLFLEQLAELGAVGLLLVVVALGTPFVTAWRTRAHPFAPIAFGGFVAFLVHAGMDWDWEMPAVTMCGLAFAGSIFAAAKREEDAIVRMAPARLVGVCLLLVAGALAFVAMNGNRALAQARSAANADDMAAATGHARTAARWAPWSSEPIAIQADAALERGDLVLARTLYGDAIRKDGQDWEYWLGLALASDGTARRRALARAVQLNPLAPAIRQLRAAGV
jgi:hypothetical protein